MATTKAQKVKMMPWVVHLKKAYDDHGEVSPGKIVK